MRSLRFLIGATCAVVLVGCGAAEEAPTTASETSAASSPAPEAEVEESPAPADEPADSEPITVAETLKFSGTTVEGTPFDGASLAGKPAVLWFWAPWCHVCAGQTPNVNALAEEYADRVTIVGVAGLSDDAAGIKTFAAETSGITNLTDADDLWSRFGIIEQSVFTVIDADGEVVSEGFLDDDELNDLVADLAG